eukprot:scaffold19218_cov113-Isochrysis_galbana.AAC.2
MLAPTLGLPAKERSSMLNHEECVQRGGGTGKCSDSLMPDRKSYARPARRGPRRRAVQAC